MLQVGVWAYSAYGNAPQMITTCPPYSWAFNMVLKSSVWFSSVLRLVIENERILNLKQRLWHCTCLDCAFLPWRARPGLKCASHISTLPGPGFLTNSECCASVVLQKLLWYWCLTVLFNSLSLLFSHLHCFKQFTVSAEIQWGEFALTFICSCWHLISV